MSDTGGYPEATAPLAGFFAAHGIGSSVFKATSRTSESFFYGVHDHEEAAKVWNEYLNERFCSGINPEVAFHGATACRLCGQP